MWPWSHMLQTPGCHGSKIIKYIPEQSKGKTDLLFLANLVSVLCLTRLCEIKKIVF